jgi:hypothetical protein
MMLFKSGVVNAVLMGLAVTPRSHAFSAVAPPSKPSATAAKSGGAPNLDPVDKSMRGVDGKDESGTVFDPTSGSAAALTRNNKGEVWVPQVRCSLG